MRMDNGVDSLEGLDDQADVTEMQGASSEQVKQTTEHTSGVASEQADEPVVLGGAVVRPTAVVEAEREAERIANEPVEDLKFVGFTPPKETGVGAFVRSHMMPIGAGVAAAVVGVVVAGLLLGGGGVEQASQVDDADLRSASSKPDEEEGDPTAVEEPPIVRISDAQFSVDNTGEFYSLESLSGEKWLERSEHDWRQSLAWGDWLFFTATGSGEDARATIRLEAFNYDTQQYASITETPMPGESKGMLVSPMFVRGEHLYIELGSDTDGATYRCKLDEKTACADSELWYDGPGRTQQYSETQLYVVESTEDDEGARQVVSLYDRGTDQLQTIVETTESGGVGSVFAQVAPDGMVWTVETTDEVLGVPVSESTSPVVSLSRLVAYDPGSGEITLVIPGVSLPIASAQYVPHDSVQDNQLLFANESQEVLFFTDQKKFGAPKSRFVADEQQQQNENILETEVRLQVPKEYLMRISQEF